jgi:hypothetical protein
VPYNTRNLLRDASALPIPQFFDPVKDDYQPMYGSDGSILVNTLRLPWRHDFPGSSLDTNEWTLVQQGSGHTVSVASSVLSIATGTTANTETIICSVRTFTVPFRAWFIYYLSQRIANQEFYLEVVDSTGQHYAQWLLDGTSATTGKFNAANAGTAGSASSVTITSTASYSIAEIELFPDEVYFVTRSVDSTSQKAYSYVRTRLIPDPLQGYYIRIRAKNLSTAPASSTTLYVDAVVVQDIAELTAEITGGRGQAVGSQAIAVFSAGGTCAVTQGTASSLRAALGTATGGGVSSYNYAGLSTTVQTIKSSAGMVYGWVIYNPNSSVAYVQVFNTTSPTLGSTVPLYSIPVPAGQTTTALFDVGITHGTAIAVAATTTMRGSTAPSIGLDVNFFYV